MRAMRMLVLALLAAVSVVAFTGCGDDSNTSTGAAGTSTGHMGMTTPETTAGVTSPAADLRVTLDELLGEHALLAMFATQKGYGGEPDFEAIAAALDENGVDLSQAIGSVYGDEAGTKFLDGGLLWRDHIGFFVDYTVGLAKKDEAAQKKAVGNLMGYNAAFANFLATATELPEPALKDAVAEHITGLKGQIDAYAAKDYPTAYANVRDAYAHMFMTGDTLAGGIAAQDPDTFSSDGATTSAADLRVTLGRLLGEHAYLAMLATQKGYSGAADFADIAKALDENSADVGAAIASVYGDEAGQTVPRREVPLERPHQVLRGLHRRAGREGQGRAGQGGREPDGLQRRFGPVPRRRDGTSAAGGPGRARDAPDAAQGPDRRLRGGRLRAGVRARA